MTGAVGSSVVFLPPDIYSAASASPSVVTSSCSADRKINVGTVERRAPVGRKELHKARPVVALIILAAFNYFSDKQHSSYCSIRTRVALISSIVSSFDPGQPGVKGWRVFLIFILKPARNALSLSSWLQSVFLFPAHRCFRNDSWGPAGQ